MLQSVEIVPAPRRAMRRAVQIECEVISGFWDEPVPHVVTDLTPYGLWIETPFPLEIGEHIALAFQPPRWRSGRQIMAFGAVRRVELRRRAGDRRRSGMGVELLDLLERDRDELAASLRGLPPPIPRGTRAPARQEMIWIDMLLTWEEDLGDRVNTFEVSERIGLVEERELEVESLSPLLTSAGRSLRGAA